MLLLVFQLGDHRFALETREVVEVLPLVHCRPLPQAPSGVVGIFSYHGVPVPLLDLSALALGAPSRSRMSTRIILVNYEDGGGTHLLGLLAEKTTATIRRTEADFSDSGVAVDSTPYLGPVTSDESGMIQRMELNELLPENARAILFRQPLEPA